MEEEIRKTGIEVIGDVSWGTHFCQFYETKEDLIDVLVPYFRAGLESNEFCMWVTSEPLNEEEAKEAMRRAVPNFDGYLKRGQIEIVPHTEWYLKDGAFNLQRVLNAWIDKLDQALAEGYDGIRVTGNTAWLEKRDWRSFADYEEEVNDAIGKYRMMAICTYSLDKCGASEVMDVVRNHQFALIKRRGEWELIESSEIKRTKEMLKRSETRLKNVFAASPDAITVSDLDGNITACNQATLELHGYSSKEELIGKSAFELIAKKDHKRAMENLKRTLEQSSVRNIEYTFLTKDGCEFSAELSASVIKDSPGNSTGFVAITKDITERKKAEEALIRQSSAVKMSTDSIVMSDIDSKIIDVNEATLRMYGTDDRGDLIGKKAIDLIAPEERERASAGMKEVLKKGYHKSREYHIFTKDGSKIPVEISTAVMKDADGKPIGFVGISRDITERKQAEDALRESEEKFRGIFESANDCMALLDRSGRILDVNGKSMEVFGGSKEEMLGKHFTRIGVFSPKDIPRVMNAFAELLTGKEPTISVRIKNKKGQEADVEVSASLVKTDGKFGSMLVVAKDVTERKKAEERIRESREKYRNLFENARDVIVTFDLRGNLTSINKTVEEYGFKKDEMTGKNMRKFVSKKYWPTLLKDVAKLARGKTVESEVEIITPKGKRIAEYRSNPVRQDKKVVGIQSVLRDITERTKAEEELRKTKNYLNNLLNYANAPIIVWDNKRRITLFNNAFVAFTGYKEESVLGRNITFLFPPPQKEEILQTIEKATKGEKWRSVEIPILYKDKKKKIALWNSANITDKEGKIVATIAQGQDITERKKMEEKLRQYSEQLEELVQKRTEELLESEKRYSVLVEEASDGVIIAQDEKVVLANKRGAEIVGYSKGELIALPFEKLVSEKHRQLAKERYTRRLRGEEVPATYEVELIAKTGECFPVEVSATLVNYQGRPADLVLFRDIRERKRMEEQRLKLKRLTAIGEAAGMVGHDLRNPLQAMVNTLHLVNEKLKSIPIKERKTFEKLGFLEMRGKLMEQVEYMNKIVADLQDYARPVQAKLVPISLHQLINDTFSTITVPEAVRISTMIGDATPKLMLDPTLMKRVFSNIILNALQAMPDGGQLTIRSYIKEETVFISVQDTGAGISKEHLPQLFQPLFTTKARGQGFGLPVCKRLVEAHDGNITVESKVGKGSTFTVKIPLRREVS